VSGGETREKTLMIQGFAARGGRLARVADPLAPTQDVVWFDLAVMAGIGAVLLAFAVSRFRRMLEKSG